MRTGKPGIITSYIHHQEKAWSSAIRFPALLQENLCFTIGAGLQGMKRLNSLFGLIIYPTIETVATETGLIQYIDYE
jgi:hypothetical protein